MRKKSALPPRGEDDSQGRAQQGLFPATGESPNDSANEGRRKSPLPRSEASGLAERADSAAPQGGPLSAEGAASEGQSAAKKSRSKRRRERRKEAKRARAREAQGGEAEGGKAAPAQPSEAHPPAASAPQQKAPQGGQGQQKRGRGQRPQQARAGEGQGHYHGKGDKGRRPESGRRREAKPFREEERDFNREPAFTKRGNKPEGFPFEDEVPPLDLGFPGLADTGFGRGRSARSQAGKKQAPAVRVLETLSPSTESLAIIEKLGSVLDEAAPLQPKHRAALKGDIRQLWEELTSDRESRSADYLGTPQALSAYLRYFLPWNVFRLSAIFTNADFCLPDNAVIVDIGSGPLTLPIALWASRPELREVPLKFYCLDRVERVMETGRTIFETLCMRTAGSLPPWEFELRKDTFGSRLPERAHLLSAANVFNEFFWKDKAPLGERALDTARTLLSYLRENGSLFIMEPGDPRSGAFISALRAALIAEGASPLGPCPHSLSCPMPGIFRHLLPPEETRTVKGDPNAAPSRFVLPPVVMPKKRDKFPWCHFGVDTDNAPAWLADLSAEAGLPKERAVFSYLWAARGAMARPLAMPLTSAPSSERERRARAGKGILVRVVSEPFGLPDGSTGQYACSSLGYTLLKRPRGEEAFEPGDLLEETSSPASRNDEKSGAIILPS